MEQNLTKFNNDRKNSKMKRSWKSENFEIHYNVRTPKAKIGLQLTKSYKKGFFQIVTDFQRNLFSLLYLRIKSNFF